MAISGYRPYRTATTKIYVNLPVKDLARTKDFFAKAGFTFNLELTNENVTCMVVGDGIFVLFLVEKFFRTMTTKRVCDSSQDVEVVLALHVESRERVDQIMSGVIRAGGRELAKLDEGSLYGRKFEDIDGHSWEVMYAG